MLEESGFVDVRIGPAADTFGGAGGESKARLFEVFGYAFLAHNLGHSPSPPLRGLGNSQIGGAFPPP